MAQHLADRVVVVGGAPLERGEQPLVDHRLCIQGLSYGLEFCRIEIGLVRVTEHDADPLGSADWHADPTSPGRASGLLGPAVIQRLVQRNRDGDPHESRSCLKSSLNQHVKCWSGRLVRPARSTAYLWTIM